MTPFCPITDLPMTYHEKPGLNVKTLSLKIKFRYLITETAYQMLQLTSHTEVIQLLRKKMLDLIKDNPADIETVILIHFNEEPLSVFNIAIDDHEPSSSDASGNNTVLYTPLPSNFFFLNYAEIYHQR